MSRKAFFVSRDCRAANAQQGEPGDATGGTPDVRRSPGCPCRDRHCAGAYLPPARWASLRVRCCFALTTSASYVAFVTAWFGCAEM
jgi:hypothetical protein